MSEAHLWLNFITCCLIIVHIHGGWITVAVLAICTMLPFVTKKLEDWAMRW